MMPRQFDINRPEDVGRFFFWMVFEKRINIHPDDEVSQYYDNTGEPMFTDDEVLYYNKVREECFEVCKRFDVSIYGIARRILNLFYFCDRNDTMEQITKHENGCLTICDAYDSLNHFN